MVYLYIFSVRATFLKFVFFCKFQSDLKNEKQEKMRKEKSKEKQGRHYGPAHYGLLEPWSPVQKRGEKGCASRDRTLVSHAEGFDLSHYAGFLQV